MIFGLGQRTRLRAVAARTRGRVDRFSRDEGEHVDQLLGGRPAARRCRLGEHCVVPRRRP